MGNNLDRVILSWPTLLSTVAASDANAPRSWIQLARTGSFVSNRYGEFQITRDDLAQMLHNFREVTPKAPTELPVDFDHLSMEAKRPGDGIAAGWMKTLELREDGHELWAEVEWTPTAAKQIAAKEYRFVSPSFVKDHTHKNGKKIGTTLLAAALTNHPFLESMKAVTLYSFSAMGDLALAVPHSQPKAAAVHLSDLGQRVSFAADAERTPELTDEERGQIFLVKSTVGDGDDQFVRLMRLDGTEFGWFRATQLEPATAPQKERNSPLPKQTVQEEAMPQTDITKLAAEFALSVNREFKNTGHWTTAFQLAQDKDERENDGRGARAYRVAGIGGEVATEAEPASVLSLSTRPGESFDSLATRYAIEKNVSLRDAVHAVAVARPDLAQARG